MLVIEAESLRPGFRFFLFCEDCHILLTYVNVIKSRYQGVGEIIRDV